MMGKAKEMTFKQAREAAGLSQQAAADICGVNIRTLQRWEANESRTPKAARSLIVMKALEREGSHETG